MNEIGQEFVFSIIIVIFDNGHVNRKFRIRNWPVDKLKRARIDLQSFKCFLMTSPKALLLKKNIVLKNTGLQVFFCIYLPRKCAVRCFHTADDLRRPSWIEIDSPSTTLNFLLPRPMQHILIKIISRKTRKRLRRTRPVLIKFHVINSI